jgi:hypothetical protein
MNFDYQSRSSRERDFHLAAEEFRIFIVRQDAVKFLFYTRQHILDHFSF